MTLHPFTPDPIGDSLRLSAVRETGLLDTGPEAAFDELTAMAAHVLDVPFAFATIVDGARSFWKSSFGVPDEAPRENSVDESFCQYVVRSQRAFVVSDASVDPRTRDNPSVKSTGVRAWAGFPLFAPGGAVLGSFCAVDTVPRAWRARDLEVLQTLAAAVSREIALRASVRDEHAARLRAEALARILQESLLLPTLPAIPDIQVGVRYQPAGRGVELVGDFFDLFQSGRDTWNFVMGDVCGKGIEAAKVATLARYTVGAAAMRSGSPAEVLAVLNERVLAQNISPEVFLTVVFGHFSITQGTCNVVLASAGHMPPLVRRTDGATETVGVSGLVAGAFPGLRVRETAVRLLPGDAIVLYTDGISEARNAAEIFGEDGVHRTVAGADLSCGADALAQTLLQAALAYATPARDDMAVLVLRYVPM